MNSTKQRTQRLGVWAVAGLALLLFNSRLMAQISFTSTTGITINDTAPATPYPSVITNANLVGTIGKLTVRLNQITHDYPDDLDIMLVGPDGTAVVLMSDAGGTFDLGRADINFSDSAGSFLPDEGQITPGGTYKPSDYELGDTWFSPAPAPNATTLSAYNGKSGNGQWKLFVQDDEVSNAGSIAGGWTLFLSLTPGFSSIATNSLVFNEDTTGTVNFTIASSDTDPSNLQVTATATTLTSKLNGTLITNSANNVIISGSGANRTLTLVPSANDSGTATVTLTVKNPATGLTGTTNISVLVQAVNDVPTIRTEQSFSSITIPAGTSTTNITVLLSDVEDPTGANLTLSVLSDNQNLLPSTFNRVTGGGNTRTVLLYPAGTNTGTARVTLQVCDNGVDGAAQCRSTSFDLIVTAPTPGLLFANTNRISIVDNAPAVPSVSTINVSGVNSTLSGVTVQVEDLNHGDMDDVDMLLVAPGGQKIVLMTGVGGAVEPAFGSFASFNDSGVSPATTTTFETTTYRPTDLDGSQPVIGGVPRPYTASLVSLNGTDPNGTWSLYVQDSAPGNTGFINGGWTLRLQTRPVVSTLVNQTTSEESAVSQTFTVGEVDNGSITNVAAAVAPLSAGTAAISGSGSTRTVSFTPANNFNGVATITVTVSDNNGASTLATYTVTVTGVNDAPTISTIPKEFTSAGVIAGPFTFTVADPDNNCADLLVTGVSQNTSVIPNENIVLGTTGDPCTRTITIFPTSALSTTTNVVNIDVFVRDLAGLSASTRFELTVLPAVNPIFQNAAAITINNNDVNGGKANTYPSTIDVNNLVGTVRKATITLFGLNMSGGNLEDLDILLVGPRGQSVLLMSDAGGANPAANLQLAFADGNPIISPTSAPASGLYSPSNYDGPEALPSPAPSATPSTALSVFNGTNPNGTWSLYIADDNVAGRGGSLSGGWMLSLETTPKIVPVTSDITNLSTREDTAITVVFLSGDQENAATNFNVTATAAGNVVDSAGLQLTRVGITNTLVITPKANVFGTNANEITLSITDPLSGVNSSLSLNVAVSSVLDAPTISDITDKTSPAGVALSVPFTIGDAETAVASLTVSATSSDQSVVRNANLIFSGSGASRTLLIQPEGAVLGTTRITVTVKDGDGLTSSDSFNFTTTRNAAVANQQAITIPEIGAATPYPSTITVNGIGGNITRTVVVIDGLTHGYPQDLDIELVGPNGKRVRLISDVGPTSSISNRRLIFADNGAAVTTALNNNTTYKPSNVDDSDIFPSPAPNGPWEATLGAAFNGMSPNGRWDLYVNDDSFPDGGSISRGWTIMFEMAPVITQVPPQTTNEDTPIDVVINFADADTDNTNLVLTATSANQSLVANSGITIIATNDFSRTIRITPVPDAPFAIEPAPGTNTINLTVSDNTGNVATSSFQLVILPVNDYPTLSGASLTNQTIVEDTTLTLPFSVGDNDTDLTNVTVTASTTDANIAAAVTRTSGANTGTVKITPAANYPTSAPSATATITLTAADNKGASSSISFDITVTQVNDRPTITAIATQTATAGRTTSPIAFTVGDVETDPRNLTLQAFSDNQTLLPDSAIVLGGSGSSRTVTLAPVGTAPGSANVTILVIDSSNASNSTNSTTFTLNVLAPSGTFAARTDAIIINDNALGTPYPSEITIQNVIGNVTGVTVTLEGLTHPIPDDVNILLESSNGTGVVLMRNAGDSIPANNVRLEFSDAASASLPDEGAITSGTYRPTDYVGPNVRFPGSTSLGVSTPLTPYQTLSSLNGSNPNGVWKLYVLDDNAGGAGQIARGWSLRIQTGPTISNPGTINANEDTVITIPFALSHQDPSRIAGLTLTARAADTTLFPSITVSGSGASQSLVILPATNRFGTNSITATVTDADGGSASTTFTVGVASVNDLPEISRLVNTSGNENATKTVRFVVTDVETAADSLTVSATSNNQGVVPDSGLRLNAIGGGTYDLAITPALNAIGQANITVSVTDANGGTTQTTFTYTVNAVNQPPTITPSAPAPIATVSGVPVQFTFTVSDPETPAGSLTLTATSGNTTVIPNANIVISTPLDTTKRIVTISPVAGQVGDVPITFTLADANSTPLRATATLLVNVRPNQDKVFSNTRAITINDSGTATASNPTIATPYPSTIDVSGLTTRVRKVTVTLTGLTHVYPDDIDILLVGPGGQKVVLMSDAGGGAGNNALNGVTITLDDDAANPLPDSGPITAGAWKPTNISDGTDLFPSPAPAGPYSATLSDFAGTDPNGQWSLYVVDDTSPDAGSISGGWSLTFTSPLTLSVTGDVSTPEETPISTSFTLSDSTTSVTNVTVTATSSDTSIATVGVSGLGDTRTVTVTPQVNATGTVTVTVTANDGTSTVSTQYKVTITAVNDQPVVSAIGNQTTRQDTPLAIQFTVTDVDSTPQQITTTATSSDQTVIRNSGLVITTNGTTRTLTITPNASGTSTIQLVTFDQSNVRQTNSFLVTVTFVSAAPTIGPVATQTMPEDSSLTVDLNVRDADTALGSLTYTVTTSDASIISASGVRITTAGTNVTATITPVPQASGTVALSVEVSDGTSRATVTFLVNVTAVNDPPSIEDLPEATIAEDDIFTTAVLINDPDSTNVTLTATSSNTSLVPNGNIQISGTGRARVLRITPAANASGSTLINLTATDEGGLIGTTFFKLNVTPVNDSPVAVGIPASLTIIEDTPKSFTFSLSDVDTALSNLVVSAISSDQSLISNANIVFSRSGADVSVTITPNPDATGTNIISIVIDDQGNTVIQQIAVTVTGQNDLPVLGPVSNVVTNEDNVVVINFTVTDKESSGTNLTVTASSSNVLLVPNANIVFSGTGSNRVATITPATNQFGTTTIRFTATDANGGSVSNSFTITFNSVNDTPDIGAIADQTIGENKSVTINFTASDAETAANNLTFSATSSNPTLIPLSGLTFGGTGNNRTLTIQPALNQSGTAIINVTVSDGTLSSSRGFVVVVNPNEAPRINPIADVTIIEDTQAKVDFTVSDDQTTNLTVTATSSRQDIVPNANIVISGSGANRTATITPLQNANGTVIINLTVSDGRANVSSGFVLTITPVNDAPTITGLTNTTIITGAIGRINFTVGDPEDTTAANIIVTAESGNETVIKSGDILLGGSGNSRVIAFSANGTNTGTAIITVSARDAQGAVTIVPFTVTVKSSAPPAAPKLAIAKGPSAGQVTITLTGDSNTSYTVEGSADLKTWTTLTTVTTDASGKATGVDTTSSGRRFYRTR